MRKSEDKKTQFSCSQYFKENPPTPSQTSLDSETPISTSEINSIIRSLATGKATGLDDNISNEMLKAISPTCSDFIHFNYSPAYTPHHNSHTDGSQHTSPPSTKKAQNKTSKLQTNIHHKLLFGKLFPSILNSFTVELAIRIITLWAELVNCTRYADLQTVIYTTTLKSKLLVDLTKLNKTCWKKYNNAPKSYSN